MNAVAEDVLSFWFEEVGPANWFAGDAALDDRIRTRFGGAWGAARDCGLAGWSTQPRSSLALVILLDQFPRNMFRDDPRAFSTDRKALAFAKSAIGRGFDRRSPPERRQFFYLPLTHSENVADQERAVRLCALNLGASEPLRHACAHRAVIRRFGRFPGRNAALGRASTPAEADWLATGGYATELADVA